MSLKFTEEFCVMTVKNDAKFGEKLIYGHFKIEMRNLTNFDPGTQKPQQFSLQWSLFDQSIKGFG